MGLDGELTTTTTLSGAVRRNHTLSGSISRNGGGMSVEPYNSDPSMDGAASAGSSTNYARGDHVHPSDTSKLDAPSGGTAGQVLKKTANGVEWGDEVFIAVYGTATSAQIEAAYQAGCLCVCKYNSGYYPLYARDSATKHAFGGVCRTIETHMICDNDTWTAGTKTFAESSAVPTAYGSFPAMDGNAATGSSTKFARGDHVHPSDTSRIAADQGIANAGKFLIVGPDGIVVPTALASWQGGSY